MKDFDMSPKTLSPYRFFLLVNTVACCMLLFLCSPLASSAASNETGAANRFGGTYTRPLLNAPSTLDPARTADIYATIVINQLFDGLVQFDSHLNPVPALAGFWEASPDGLTWTFYLRKGVKFHHGREVTSEDFVYSFTRLLDPSTKSKVARRFKHVRGAEAFRSKKAPRVDGFQALDRYTLQISLVKPYTALLSVLAMANTKVVPRELVEQSGKPFGEHPVGTGPFTFRKWESNESIVLDAYEAYHEGRPYLDQIEFKIGKQDSEMLEAFLRGELEETIVPSSKLGELQQDPRYRPYQHLRKPLLHLLYIGFNTQKPPFDNRKVRQAFNYAINKEAIVREIRNGNANVASGILPPGMPGYDPAIKGYYYNPKRARELLAEAGYPGGKGLPVIELWHGTKETTGQREMEAYRDDLAAIGVNITIHKAKDWPTLKGLLNAGKLSMFRLGWHSDIPDPDNVFSPLFSSQSPLNRTFYRNADIDKMIEQARGQRDYMQRIQLYREAERRLIEDANLISQHHRVFENLYQPYVRGMEVTSAGVQYIPMKKVWLQRADHQRASHP